MIATERLTLIPANPAVLRAALLGAPALAAALGAEVPESWPPEYLDVAALEFTLARLEEQPGDAAWWMYFVLRRAEGSKPTLIGSAGYKGPPTADGAVEVGYGIVADHRLQGFATEATRGLLARAFSKPDVRLVIAETLPELTGSIGVLRRCGFHRLAESSEPGVIRFALSRE